MSEIWHYITGDTYTDGRLQIFKKHYENEILKDVVEYTRLQSYEKYGIPGIRWMLIHLRVEWANNKESLRNIDRAIAAGQEIKDV